MKKIILLIDDDVYLTDIVKFLLTKENYTVLVSHEPMKGLQLASTQKPDLILLDLMMPGLSGEETAKMMKNHPVVKNIPVVFFTALLSPKDKEKEDLTVLVDGLNYPAIAKPFEAPDLLNRIKRLLEN